MGTGAATAVMTGTGVAAMATVKGAIAATAVDAAGTTAMAVAMPTAGAGAKARGMAERVHPIPGAAGARMRPVRGVTAKAMPAHPG